MHLATSFAGEENTAGPSKAIAFDIPAQPLAQALDAYARATGMATVVDQELIAGRHSATVKGSLADFTGGHRLVDPLCQRRCIHIRPNRWRDNTSKCSKQRFSGGDNLSSKLFRRSARDAETVALRKSASAAGSLPVGITALDRSERRGIGLPFPRLDRRQPARYGHCRFTRIGDRYSAAQRAAATDHGGAVADFR
jgi:hypothetical protein